MTGLKTRLVHVALVVGMGVVAVSPAIARPAYAVPAAPAPVACVGCWVPALNTSWNWVLQHVPHAPYRAVSMYDIDGFDATAGDVSAMHAVGIKVVCYLSAGTWENWRPDAAQFPLALLGKKNGWPGEKWLDVRDAQLVGSVLLSIMRARLDMCKQKGFDGVEFDNVDGYTNKSGFLLTGADQLFYNATLANEAHARGLMVLQKNDLEQIPALLPYFDGALNELCNKYKECTTVQNGSFGYDQYIAARKPVFQAEYFATKKFCPADNASNFNGVRFKKTLNDSLYEPCR